VEADTLRETIVLYLPLHDGPLSYAPLFTRAVAGAESNLAIALSRLGKRARWVSRVGADPFGDALVQAVRGEGVDASFVARDPAAPTAVFFREMKGGGEPHVFYYRAGSAASRLRSEEVDSAWLDGARLLHVTGITPALGEGPREATFALMRLARERGIPVSFDPNLRRKLWDDETSRKTLLAMVPLCDLFMPGLEEARFLLGEAEPEVIGRRFLDLGPEVVALKRGTEGAVGFAEGCVVHSPSVPVSRVIDPIGAGDAFDAGFLSVLLDEPSPVDLPTDRRETVLKGALDRANLMGALATQFKGDWEGLPTLEELRRIEARAEAVTR
jgi:2-dehydro-3-deoxygluconokinase